jgi:hypothetical protein
MVKVPEEVIVPPLNPLPEATDVTVPEPPADVWVVPLLNVIVVPLTVIGIFIPN